MKPALIFGDHMILQANKPIRVFGQAQGCVFVTLGGKTVTAEAKNGTFLAVLPAMLYGGPYTMTVSGDGDEYTFADVCVGEVFLCAGQSNMEYKIKNCDEDKDPKPEYAGDPALRYYISDRPGIENEILRPDSGWTPADRETVPEWSAVGWYLGSYARKQGIPYVGIVLCAKSSSCIQTFLREDDVCGTAFDFPADKLHPDQTRGCFPWNASGYLYHRMMEPVFPYTFGNVAWYQGESNTSPAESDVYASLVERLASRFRTADLDPGLPFTIIQIADYDYPWHEESWKRVQKQQLSAEVLVPGLHTIVISDISERCYIHPLNKEPVGIRLFESMRAHGTV